jgi:hypothetical protein
MEKPMITSEQTRKGKSKRQAEPSRIFQFRVVVPVLYMVFESFDKGLMRKSPWEMFSSILPARGRLHMLPLNLK